VRLATWNVNSLKARLERVEAWIADVSPDVLCLQETKLADAAFPSMVFHGLGYESVHHGEGRWNGVAIVSRVGLTDVTSGFGDDAGADPEARLVWATCGPVRVASCYVPNGREVGCDHYAYKLRWLDRLRAVLAARERADRHLAVCGDFNVAPADLDVWDPAEFVGSTHVSEPERTALQALEAWGLVDVFRAEHPDQQTFSWWDYRAGNFHKGKGMRIDLVLATSSLAAAVTDVRIDRDARKGKSPSDHAPVIVDLDL
jgi:exodeoxyribonuclease III